MSRIDDRSPGLSGLHQEFHELCAQGLVRQRRRVTPLGDGWCQLQGRRLKDFSANDYLNLAQDPRVIASGMQAMQVAGVGARASALVSGRTDWHVQLEERLAQFERQSAALLFPSGYAANLGTISALVGPDDAIFCDRLNHASLVDGCRLSGARLRVYRHDHLEKLERELRKATDVRRRLIVTDSVFSMDGHVAPLKDLCRLAEDHDALLLVDEAHGTGVFGDNGRGVAELLGVEHRIPVRIGTMSKALGTLGGFAAGSQQLVDWLWNRARPQMFSTALPPAICAATLTALDLVDQEPWRREHMLQMADLLRNGLRERGITTPSKSMGPIIPIILNSPERAVAAAMELEMRGFLVPAIRPPTVPTGTSRLRITVSAAHSKEDIGRLIEALDAVLVGDQEFDSSSGHFYSFRAVDKNG